jgi:hypothetical protein
MNDIKITIYNALKTITSNVYQIRPEVIEQMPTITFTVNQDIPEYVLEKELARQQYQVTVDIWAKTTAETSTLYNSVESTMRNINFLCINSQDIPEPDGYAHKNMVFEF